MKTINLTEEHKSKLLEMCKTLFPEYKYWNLHDGVCDLCSENTLDYSLKRKPEWNSYFRTHWFEFLVMQITPKILNGYVDNCYSDSDLAHEDYYVGNIKIIYLNGSHPIDYVYEEFKKTFKK